MYVICDFHCLSVGTKDVTDQILSDRRHGRRPRDTLPRNLLTPSLRLSPQLSLHIPKRRNRPDTSPHKRQRPPNNIRNLPIQRKNQRRTKHSTPIGANSPKRTQPPQHRAKNVARLVAPIKRDAEIGAAGPVDGADVFDEGVDARSELGSAGHGGDAERGGEVEGAEGVD